MHHPTRHLFWLIVSTVTAVLAVSLLPYVISAPSDRSSPHQERASSRHRSISSGAAAVPFDLQFIDTMIAHHRGAIAMARLAKTNAIHAELRGMAEGMAQNQEREIKQMLDWRSRWFKTQENAKNMDLPGMRDSIKFMDHERVKKTNGQQFDLIFLDMMIPHHQGAVVMSQDTVQNAEHPQVKQLASRIIEQQQREINQMRQWKSAWTENQNQPR